MKDFLSSLTELNSLSSFEGDSIKIPDCMGFSVVIKSKE